MDGWPKVALVATPDVGAAILYQFNTTRKAHVGHAGFDSGTAEWSGEPGAQGGTEGYRSIRFTHYVDGSDAAAVTALTTLSRLLMADYGWLLIQQRPTAAPVWAKVWRSTPGALSWDRVLLDDGAVAGKYGIDLALTADPLLYGEKITLANAVTVNNDPAAGTNPNVLILGAVVGDAPAPAVLTIDNDNKANKTALHQLAAVRSTYTAPTVLQFGSTELWTTLTNFAASPTTDSAFSGGSYRATAFTGIDTEARLSMLLPPGDWQAMLRISPTTADTTVRVTLATANMGSSVETVVPAGGTDIARWVNIGRLRTPATWVSEEILLASPTTTTAVNLFLARTAGTGQWRVDALVLFPAPTSSRTLLLWNKDAVSGTPPQILDGEYEVVYTKAVGSGELIHDPVQVIGGFPLLWPGQTNALHIYSNIDRFAAGDVIANTFSVTATYRPRWLWPRP